MFGHSLDYLILRSLAHSRNLATEDELDGVADMVTVEDFDREMPKFHNLVRCFEGALPLAPELRYLDMGCGTGELTIAFARLGVRSITGVDFLPRAIERARANAQLLGAPPGVQFVCRDLHAWAPEEKFDVLLSFDAMEHIDQPKLFLRKMADFINPGGIAVLAFGPLFHSPFGDHMREFFTVQIPWRGVLFSEAAILKLRREAYRPTDRARCYREIAGGLNQMRYAEFLSYARQAGWRFEFLRVNTFLRRIAPLRALSDALMQLPRLQNYFAHNVYAVLRRADDSR
jgi:SAM-dependent methyltransferase